MEDRTATCRCGIARHNLNPGFVGSSTFLVGPLIPDTNDDDGEQIGARKPVKHACGGGCLNKAVPEALTRTKAATSSPMPEDAEPIPWPFSLADILFD